MRREVGLPELSLGERDRRWTHVREAMAGAGLGCLVSYGAPQEFDFWTANARYLSQIGGNCEQVAVVLPAMERDPVAIVSSPTFLPYWRRAQHWIGDVRCRRGTWAGSIAAVVRELAPRGTRVGVDGLGSPLDPEGWLPHATYVELAGVLAGYEIVGVGDTLERLRTVKSDEELDVLRQAAELGDEMLAVCADTARPGVLETEVYAAMRHAMLAGGGEEPTLFLWAADAAPFPHPFRVPAPRPLEPSDVIILEIHPKRSGYCTHVERSFVLGGATPAQRRIHDGCLAVFDEGLRQFQVGNSIRRAMAEVERVVRDAGLDFCELGIHGHGLGSLEHPRFRLHARQADEAAIGSAGDLFVEGMVFAFNIDLVDPSYHAGDTGLVLADTVVITREGPRVLHAFSRELQELR